MKNFKKGDVVRANDSYDGQFTAGKEYVVSADHNNNSWGCVMIERGDQGSTTNGWGETFFDLVRRPWKVGDKVRVVSSWHKRIVGEVAVVKRVDEDKPFIQFADGLVWWVGDDIEAVIEVAPEVAVPSLSDTLSLKPQTRTVLAHLQAGKAITPLKARTVYGIESLSSRISEIKGVGYNVTSEMRKDEGGQRYKRYSLAA